jgi:hypothetical protein
MLIDFAADFADLLTDWSGVRRSAGSDNAEGVFVPGAEVPFTFKAVPPQPITMNELQQVEGGEFTRSIVKTYTPYPLLNNDIVTYDGIDYEMLQFDNRGPLGSHRKAYLVRVQDDH